MKHSADEEKNLQSVPIMAVDKTPAWKKAGNTDRWTEIIFRALASRVAKRWRFVSFRGLGGGQWKGVVSGASWTNFPACSIILSSCCASQSCSPSPEKETCPTFISIFASPIYVSVKIFPKPTSYTPFKPDRQNFEWLSDTGHLRTHYNRYL